MPPPNRRMEVLALLPEPEDVAPNRGLRGTVAQLVTLIDLNKPSVCRYLRELKALDLAHIARWRPTGGIPAAVWVKGAGEDAPMPGLKTPGQYSKKHRKNVKTAIERARRGFKYDERYAGQVAKALADDVAQRTRVNPQHWFSQLGI
jgi:hypothetical protein